MTETFLAAGYGSFLLALALALDWLARHTHHRSDRYRTAGFAYHEHLDAWECPEGQHLWRHEDDRERRLVRYRGKPRVCNACPAKPRCTDSDEGREIVRFLDPWIASEAGRFHRGVSVLLVGLAGLIAVVALVRNHELEGLLVLGPLLATAALVAWRLALALRPRPVPAPAR
jgi:hypothetical protein